MKVHRTVVGNGVILHVDSDQHDLCKRKLYLVSNASHYLGHAFQKSFVGLTVFCANMLLIDGFYSVHAFIYWVVFSDIMALSSR